MQMPCNDHSQLLLLKEFVFRGKFNVPRVHKDIMWAEVYQNINFFLTFCNEREGNEQTLIQCV